ncbi:HpcH/HpaI aldolase/citrate lyase family protein [Sphingomicrobium sediminis]|uniref:CoA ester lyase n=1 Tax=Sphingomicrobium sediminis TaxID=2950949 RepID=A0A9X2J367_9SPHN|nr:CoA ester lyase [Sphingomicrobium sediminis]MCM8556976.1 CoA ester lyase [Sphingomicrobium sediminis]
MTQRKFARRAALFDRPAVLFCPASRERAVAKAKDSGADMVIFDLEDAVAEADKAAARDAAVAAVAEEWPMPVGIRMNAIGSPHHAADVAALCGSAADFLVVPLVGCAEEIAAVAEKATQPVAAMVETARGVLAAPDIAKVAAMLIVGTNDLAADLRLPSSSGRGAMSHAIQRVVLAARARGVAVYDGVFNRIDDAEGFAEEAAESASLGFDGKTLIHPSHIAPCQEAFAPSDADIERAERMLAAAAERGGAINFEGEMVEEMHLASARRLLERAGH